MIAHGHAASSTEIAATTLRDSFSMKTLALVTMLFLPGTSVASIFSMPLFHWNTGDNNGQILDDKFWVFWVLTVPLTLLTFSVWAGCMCFRRKPTQRDRHAGLVTLESV